MKRGDHTLSISLSTSLMVHGLAVCAFAWWVILSTGPPKLAPIDRESLIIKQVAREMAQQQPPPPPAKKKPAPPPEDKYEKPDDSFRDDSGEHDGVGTANRSSKGDHPMQAQRGMEQADLMKPGAKKFDADSPVAASAGKQDDSASSSQQATRWGQKSPDLTTEPEGKDELTDKPALAMLNDQGTLPVPLAKQPRSSTATPSGEAEASPRKPTAQPPSPAPSALKELSGHQAQVSDTDSSAFAKAPSSVFQDGKLLGRKGWKVDTTKPRFSDASAADYYAMGKFRTVLGVRVDANENVQNVVLLQSSGSQNIDNDCITAVWEWKLEPEKDKDGKITSYLWTVVLE